MTWAMSRMTRAMSRQPFRRRFTRRTGAGRDRLGNPRLARPEPARAGQIRGSKRFWRVVIALNPGNSLLYWLFGRR